MSRKGSVHYNLTDPIYILEIEYNDGKRMRRPLVTFKGLEQAIATTELNMSKNTWGVKDYIVYECQPNWKVVPKGVIGGKVHP